MSVYDKCKLEASLTEYNNRVLKEFKEWRESSQKPLRIIAFKLWLDKKALVEWTEGKRAFGWGVLNDLEKYMDNH